MTGYLQRMADSALRPGRAIRPMLGSLFGPADSAAASETPALEENVLSSTVDRPAPMRPSADAAPSAPMVRSAPSTPVRSAPSASDDRAAAPYVPLVARAPETASEIEQPAMAQHTSNPLPTAQHTLNPSSTAQRTSNPLPTPPSAASDNDEPGGRPMRLAAEAAPPPRQAPSAADTVETLRPAHPVSAIARLPRPADVRAKPRAAVAFSPAQPRGRFHDAQAVSAQGDDIQIHIGRIEVTAVRPAPASQPAGKTRRAAPSLDEYLRRRDGRAP
jgi:hypothetical protein